MSIDSSLKNRAGLTGRRAVLTRAERITKMTEEGRFDEEQDSPFGLPKMRTLRSRAGSKSKKEEAPAAEVEGDAAADGETPAAEE